MMSAETELLYVKIHRVAQLLQQAIDEEFGAEDMTRLNWLAALHLDDAGTLSVSQLADRLKIGPVTTSRLVDRMVNGGWIDRQTSTEDRRASVLRTTDKATQAVQRLAPRVDPFREATLQDLSVTERADLCDLLDRIEARLGAMRRTPQPRGR